jgi:hypothetical protein
MLPQIAQDRRLSDRRERVRNVIHGRLLIWSGPKSLDRDNQIDRRKDGTGSKDLPTFEPLPMGLNWGGRISIHLRSWPMGGPRSPQLTCCKGGARDNSQWVGNSVAQKAVEEAIEYLRHRGTIGVVAACIQRFLPGAGGGGADGNEPEGPQGIGMSGESWSDERTKGQLPRIGY